jgi:hypothetical protein
MSQLIQLSAIMLVGLIAVTLIDTIGAYASKVMNFNYGYLTILSFIVYASIGSFISKHYSFNTAFAINLVIGFYDATIGWNLSRRLGANTGLSEDQLRKITVSRNLTVMLPITLLFTYIGHLLK